MSCKMCIKCTTSPIYSHRPPPDHHCITSAKLSYLKFKQCLSQNASPYRHKLSDHDTLAVATLEMESIAMNLNHDSFSPFLTYLSAMSSSDKSPIRKQCVRILGVLSVTHGDALSPHVFKMLAAVVRRLRDSNSAVRTASIGAVTSIASEISSPAFMSLSKLLVEAVLTGYDQNSQIGLALCLSTIIEASPDPEPVQLQKLLLRVLKLIKSDSFKARPALLAVIGSICAVISGF